MILPYKIFVISLAAFVLSSAVLLVVGKLSTSNITWSPLTKHVINSGFVWAVYLWTPSFLCAVGSWIYIIVTY